MKIKLFILVYMALIFAVSINGQTREKPFGHFESVKIQKYKDYFKSDPATKKTFQKFNRVRIIQNSVNYAAIGIEVVTIAMAAQISADNSSVPADALVFLAGTAASVSLALIGNLVTIPIKRGHKKKLLKIEQHKKRLFDRESLGFQPNEFDIQNYPHFELGSTTSGYGMLYSF